MLESHVHPNAREFAELAGVVETDQRMMPIGRSKVLADRQQIAINAPQVRIV